jgi:hypothetical protein
LSNDNIALSCLAPAGAAYSSGAGSWTSGIVAGAAEKGRLQARLRAELAQARDEAADADEQSIAPAAEAACEHLIDLVLDGLVWQSPKLRLCASGTDDGGAVIVIDNPERNRRLTLEIPPDGSRVLVARLEADDSIKRSPHPIAVLPLKQHVAWIAGV